MGWFSRKGMAPAAGPLVPGWFQSLGGDEAGGFARSYEAQVDEVFRRNPIGQRSVRLISGAVGGLTLFANEAGGDAALKLVRAEALMERVAASLLLHGNAFVRLIADDREQPLGLYLLRPERVEVNLGRDGWPVSYTYRAGARSDIYPRSDPLGRVQLAHIRALNPGDDHYGLGCLDAAIAPASVHNRAAKWNKALLDNAARPSGAMVYAPGDGSTLSGEQFDRLKSELEMQFSGSANAGRPMLLDGGLSWQALSLTPADMDFVALKEGAARDIALSFGVPPVLVGLPGDATYSNAREAGRALYRQTVLPLAGQILAGLEALLGDWLGEVRLQVDTDRISELAEDRAKLWGMLSAADFLTRAEKRDMVGFAPDGLGEGLGQGLGQGLGGGQ